MKKILSSLLLIAVFFAFSCRNFGIRIKGNGVIGREMRNVGSFTDVSLQGSPDIILHLGDHCEVTIEADENLIPYIETKVSGSELIVEIKSGSNISTHHNLVVHVTAPEFREITIAGSGDITAEEKINSNEKMKFKIAGSGDIKADVNAPDIDCSIAGSGNLSLSGETKEQDISVKGNGDVQNENLKTEHTTVDIKGSGNVNVHASVKLDVDIAGSGDVEYRGNPSVTQNIHGSGEVKKM